MMMSDNIHDDLRRCKRGRVRGAVTSDVTINQGYSVLMLVILLSIWASSDHALVLGSNERHVGHR
jgi:hypothetical protein